MTEWRHETAGVLTVAGRVLRRGGQALFFRPPRGPHRSPALAGAACEELRLNSSGHVLHALLLHPSSVAAKGLIVHLHGSAADARIAAANALRLLGDGYAVLAAEYRGYGSSGGSPTIAGIHEDAAACVRWALQVAQQKGLRLVLFGESLGGAVALWLAAQPEFHNALAAVISDSTFTSYRTLLCGRLEALWYGKPLRFLAAALPGQYDPIDWVGRVAPIPLLLMHNKDDQLVPVQHAVELFTAAAQPKELWLTEGAQHGGALQHDVLRDRIATYLGKISGWRDCRDQGMFGAGQ